MSALKVYRDRGDRPGGEISDPLLTHRDAIVARGTYELDRATSGVQVSGSGFFTGTIPEPGELRILVDRKGRQRRGVIDEVEVVFSRADETSFTADCNLTIEAEL